MKVFIAGFITAFIITVFIEAVVDFFLFYYKRKKRCEECNFPQKIFAWFYLRGIISYEL